jgi:aminoglycoside/choline kinase family phosphotransferase
VLVEWPELLPAGLTENRLDIALVITGTGRKALLKPSGSWRERLGRTREIRSFLERSGWTGASREPLAGDASSRAYERVSLETGSCLLMNAPARPEGPAIHGGRSYDAIAHRARDVVPFVAIGQALRAAGVRVPEIHAADVNAGLLLLEDLGAEGIVAPDGAPLLERYEAAIDLLVLMHGRIWPEEAPAPGRGAFRIPPYDRDALLVEISLFPDWFGGHGGEPAFPAMHRAPFLEAWSGVLEETRSVSTLVLRDFHSPNILWQADATGTDRVGVLDFQDALLGHPAYDVASLAQDARVPLSPEQEGHLKSRYVAGRIEADPDFDTQAFDAAFAVLGAQRATKVLGAFTRLALVDGKPGYQRHRARLKALLGRTLSHPVLSDLRVWYEPYL